MYNLPSLCSKCNLCFLLSWTLLYSSSYTQFILPTASAICRHGNKMLCRCLFYSENGELGDVTIVVCHKKAHYSIAQQAIGILNKLQSSHHAFSQFFTHASTATHTLTPTHLTDSSETLMNNLLACFCQFGHVAIISEGNSTPLLSLCYILIIFIIIHCILYSTASN